MSRFLDHADALAAHLAATLEWCKAPTPEAYRVPVIVDRKLDINSIIAQTIANAKGASIVILFRGGKNPDPKSRLLRMGGDYSIFVMTRPLFRDGQVTCDDLMEAAAEAAHGWMPAGGKSPVTQRLEIRDVELRPMKGLMIYELTGTIQRLSSIAP